MGRLWSIVKDTYALFSGRNCTILAAAMAYQALFSVAPMLVIAVSAVSLVIGERAAQGELANQLGGFVGPEGAEVIQSLVQGAYGSGRSGLAAAVGVVVLVVASTSLFSQLQQSLDLVWADQACADKDRAKAPVRNRGAGWRAVVWTRAVDFAMVLGVGAVLLLFVLVHAALPVALRYLPGFLPGARLALTVGENAAAVAVFALLFALIFRYLPAWRVGWGDAWAGGAATSLLFAAGRSVIGLYLGRQHLGLIGSAGAVLVILAWVYYSTLIFFLGASFTRVWADRRERE
jgi:membrane protein